MFYCFPLVSIAARFLGIGQLNYDFFWVPALAIAFVLSIGAKFWKKYMVLLVWVAIFLFIKYGIPFLYENIQLYPWLMDCKWVAYLFFTILWINRFGNPSGEVIYKGSLFFSKVYIVYAIWILITSQLGREGIIMEANYDGFMILMGFCLIDKYQHRKTEWLFFIMATFLTLSRTGLVALAVMLIYRISRKNILYLVPLAPVGLGIALLAIFIRGDDSVEHMDRFVFFHQAFVYFSHTSIWNTLFGSTPGISLQMPVVDGFQWYIDNFEQLRGVRGIYPFYFHSTYLRLALTWGFFVFLIYTFFFIYKFFCSRLLPFKYLCLLVLVQSLSLSVLTIQNVSVLFFMLLFLLLSEEKKYKKSIA